MAHEKEQKKMASDKVKETQDIKNSKDCKINKFDGLCHSKDGLIWHPNGVRKMGVNEWVGTEEELIKSKHHHVKDFNDEEMQNDKVMNEISESRNLSKNRDVVDFSSDN